MEIGDVWLAYFPFEDDPLQGKVRPVVVIDFNDETTLVMSIKVTTHEPRTQFDVQLLDYLGAGLFKPSVARVSHVIDLPLRDFRKWLGRLSMVDIVAIQTRLREFMDA